MSKAQDVLFSLIKKWMQLHAKDFLTLYGEGQYTQLAEAVCDQFDKHEFLDNPDNPVWTWAVEILDDHIKNKKAQ